ncbi:MAG: ABC transporter substrate-binding protein [Peptostreptococcaceae bacterium]|nr:ABC transporter substrate-binding protein [Peptostreptococcaceae bacterium]
MKCLRINRLKGKKYLYILAKSLALCLLFLIIILSATGCDDQNKVKEVNIAEQFGIAYAPLQIMREQHLLEKALPGVKINWKQYGGPVPMREAMLAGEVDLGFMGSAPVLIGIDNGMKWKYATGISFNQVALVTDQPNIKSLRDFSDTDRIAILSPGSTQHALLSIASNQVFGDPNKFDNQIVSLSHPDATDALIADTEIVAHFSTPPYIDKELAQGMHIVTTGEEIMGQPFTFITGVALVEFYENQPDEYDAFIIALNTAIDFINNNMDEAVSILAPVYGIDESTLKAQMTYNGTIYSNELIGIQKLADEMYRINMLKNPIDLKKAIFPKVRIK